MNNVSRGAIIATVLAVAWVVGLLIFRAAEQGALDLRVVFDVVFAPISLMLIAAAVGLTLRSRKQHRSN